MPTNKLACKDLHSKNNSIDNNKVLGRYCTEEQKALLVNNLNCIHYKKGETIFYEGQPTFLIYLIYSGIVKLWKEGQHREGQIIRFSKRGEIMGFWGCLEKEKYSLSATALVDTNVCYIKKKIFFDVFRNNFEIFFYILQEYIRNLKKVESDIRNMAEMNVREKVAKAILILLDCFGNNINNTNLKTVLSRQEIASLAGLNIDSVSKQLAVFKREKIIVADENKISIDHKALKKIILPYSFIDSNGSI